MKTKTLAKPAPSYRLAVYDDRNEPVTVGHSLMINGVSGERRILHYQVKPGNPTDQFPYNIGIDGAALAWAKENGVAEIHYERRGTRGVYILGMKHAEELRRNRAPVARIDRRTIVYLRVGAFTHHLGPRWYDLPASEAQEVMINDKAEEYAQGAML